MYPLEADVFRLEQIAGPGFPETFPGSVLKVACLGTPESQATQDSWSPYFWPVFFSELLGNCLKV